MPQTWKVRLSVLMVLAGILIVWVWGRQAPWQPNKVQDIPKPNDFPAPDSLTPLEELREALNTTTTDFDRQTRINERRLRLADAMVQPKSAGIELAVAALVSLKADDERPGLQERAAHVLERLGDKRVHALVEILGYEKGRYFEAALAVLGSTATKAGTPPVLKEEAASALMKGLKDRGYTSDKRVSLRATAALADLGPAAVPALIAGLNGPDRDVRFWAAVALARIDVNQSLKFCRFSLRASPHPRGTSRCMRHWP